jgi:acyl-CoA dehydrogenase family protein 9
MPGFRVERLIRKMGIRGSTQAELAYDGLRVPTDHVLGVVGKGFGVAVHVLNGGRLSLAAGCTAGAKQVSIEMTSFAAQRVQFGRPIADFEITQRKLARTASDIYAADAMLGILTDLASAKPGVDADDWSLEAACCKVFASDMIWRSADDLVQIAGGRGFVKPYSYERWLRDSRINRIFEGTNEILRLFIALNGIQGPAERLKEIGSALRKPVRNLGLISGFAASRIRSALGATPTLDVALHDRLATHKRYFEKHIAELHTITERVIQHYRADIVERQQELERLAYMAIELFATGCVLARTQRLIEERGVALCEREIELCDLFVVESGRRFRASREAVQSPQDELRRAVAKAVRGAGGYFVTDAILEAGADTANLATENPEIHIEAQQDMAKGGSSNVSLVSIGSHTGTHVDAAKHMILGGAGVDAIPLDALIGPAIVLAFDDDVMAVTEAYLRTQPIAGHERVLLKTRNSNFIREREFHPDYTYLAPDGAEYLVSLGVRLVGIDYLSIAQFHSGQ